METLFLSVITITLLLTLVLVPQPLSSDNADGNA